MNILIITGTSSGLGMELSNQAILEGNFVISISRTRNVLLEKNKKFTHINHDFCRRLSINKIKKIQYYISTIQYKKIYLFLNAAIDQKDFSHQKINWVAFNEQLNINFANQLFLFQELTEIVIINKLVNISSLNFFFKLKGSSVGYNISKTLSLETFEIIAQYIKNIDIRHVFLSGMQTKMYKKSLKRNLDEKRNCFAEKFNNALKPTIVAKSILKFINNTSTKTLYIPKKYKWLMLLKHLHNIIKLFK
jgi:short-subunit dehydrogenase